MAETRVSATTTQTVSSKGHDGFTLAVVTGSEISPQRTRSTQRRIVNRNPK